MKICEGKLNAGGMFSIFPVVYLALIGVSSGCATGANTPPNENMRIFTLPKDEVISETELAMVHDWRGKVLLVQGDLDGATREFRTATQLSPASSVPHNNLAIALYHQNNFSGARTEFLVAIQLDPGYAEAWSNLGFVLFDDGEIRSAVKRWHGAVKLNPRRASAWAGLAIGLFKMGDTGGAVKSYIEALRLDARYTDLGYLHHVRRWSSIARQHAALILELFKSNNQVLTQQESKV